MKNRAQITAIYLSKKYNCHTLFEVSATVERIYVSNINVDDYRDIYILP